MKSAILAAALFILAGPALALADPALNSDWAPLFDGKTTHGWHSYGKSEVLPEWQVIDGVLTLTKGGGGDLITDAEYENFDLEFDWKISLKGNSGVMYRVWEPAGAYPWLSGPEYQLLDNAHLPEPPIEQAAALFALYAPIKDMTKPTGAFNHSRLLVDHGHVEHWLNGVKVVEYDIFSPDFSARVAASKFSKMPEFAKHERGRIALQDHGDPVAFRNIRIKIR